MQVTPEQILVSVGLVLAAWYLMATIYNRRRGHAAYRWLASGLDVFGESHEGKWLGSASSGAQLTVSRAVQPFRRVEVIYLLESRELLPLWLVDLIRDKRDQLIFKAVVRGKHLAEVEIAPSASRTARRIRKRIDDSWSVGEENGFFIAQRGRDADRILEGFDTFLAAYGDQIRSISWSEGRPDVIIILSFGPLLAENEKASTLFASLKEAVEGATLDQDAQ
jgi:hypothetical protein